MRLIYLIGIIALLSAIMLVTPAMAKTIYVNETGWWIDGGEFNASSSPVEYVVRDSPYLEDGDTVFVYNGTYEVTLLHNDNLAIQKSITLKGEGADVVTFDLTHPTIGDRWRICLQAGANGTIVDGLKIVNSTKGIEVEVGAPDCIVRNCVFENILDDLGIQIFAFNLTFENNTILNPPRAYYYIEITQYADFCTIVNNTFKDGIFTDTTWSGVIGLETNNCTIVDNTFVNNTGAGILLNAASNNTIARNNIYSNERGLWWQQWGGDESEGNKIYLNNFNNTENVVLCEWGVPITNNIWNSTELIEYVYDSYEGENYLGNNWSDYTGSDGDGDGIGDVPYVIPGSTDMDYRPLMAGFENYPAPAAGICGDVNKDDAVDFIDVGLVGRHKLYGDALADEWAANVNGDGSIDFIDVGLIGRHKLYGDALSCK